MKRAVVLFVLAAAVAGCGGGGAKESDDSEARSAESAAAASASADAKKATCDRLGREWAVKAKDVNRKFALGLADDSQALMDELGNIVDEMDIEQCPDGSASVRGLASLANYEAALIHAKLLGCGADLDCSIRLSQQWIKKGSPLVIQVQNLVGIDPGIN